MTAGSVLGAASSPGSPRSPSPLTRSRCAHHRRGHRRPDGQLPGHVHRPRRRRRDRRCYGR